MAHDVNDKLERGIQVHKDVFALGVAIYGAEHLRKLMRSTLADMQGMDYVELPYSLAKSIHDTLEVYIRKNLSYLGASKLIHFDHREGSLKLTELGALSMKKLADRVRHLL